MGKAIKSLDILKFISAISIIGLHCFRFNIATYDYWYICANRFGVPCFFIISSFLLFRKKLKWENIILFIKRIAKLYLFWFIATIPLTIYSRFIANHTLSLEEKIINFIHTTIWSASFSGSWYLMALIQGVLIIFFLKKYLPNSLIIFISLLIYFIPCIAASYNFLFTENSYITKFISLFTTIIFRPYHCFPAGLIYISIGMCIAENYYKIISNMSYKKGIFLILTSISLWFIENYYIYEASNGFRADSDAFFSLIPLSTSLILITLYLNTKISINFNTCLIREMSTIMYFSQFAFIFILSKLQRINVLPISNITLYFLVIFSTIILTYILRSLRTKYNIFKYAF